MPHGATAVDLAYAIHTDVGNTCVAVKVDRNYVPLRTQLLTGQTVEVVTAPWAHPNPNWLNFVATGKARANIRSRLKNLRSGEAVDLGRRLLGQALESESQALEGIPKKCIENLLSEFGLEDESSLYEDIGMGTRIAPFVARRLLAEHRGESPRVGNGADPDGDDSEPILIRGSEGMLVTFGKCCHPIPGDPILGFVSTGRGLVIHTQSCRNVSEFVNRPERWVDVDWGTEIQDDFPVEVRVDIVNQKGALATIAAAIADAGANIDNVVFEERDGLNSTLKFVVEVTDRIHLAGIIRRLRIISEVNRITRTLG